MWRRRDRSKLEWRAQVALTPHDMTRADVDAPNLTSGHDIIEPSYHPACTAAEVQQPASVSNMKIRGNKYFLHRINVDVP